MHAKTFVCLLAVVMTAVSAAAMPSIGNKNVLDVRSSVSLKNGKSCSQSVQCQSQFCNRAKCDDKKAVGKSCYKDVGCQSGICGTNGKCAVTNKQALGTKCDKSVQCASGYCGRARCAAKLANGQACYKDVGCTSGFCVNATCSATNGTSTTPPPPSTDGGSGKGNLGDFSSGTLGAWTAAPADKVAVVADASSPGGYVVRMTASDGVSTLISRDNIPAAVQRRQSDNVVDPTFYLAAQFEFRVTSYTRLANDADDPGSTACAASIIVNGKATGLQSIGGGSGPDPPLNTWYTMSNGNLGYTDQLTSVGIGPICHQNALMTMDIRNITKYVDDLRSRYQ